MSSISEAGWRYLIRDPDLEVCVYHDARLAEVRSFRGFQRHPQLSKLQSRTQA
jgi:uncharacterized protein YqiB (DUF1249 family)